MLMDKVEGASREGKERTVDEDYLMNHSLLFQCAHHLLQLWYDHNAFYPALYRS